jgi:hypothetical protein
MFKPSLRSSPVTPPTFRPLGQPETRFSDEKVVRPSKMRNKTACFGWYGRAVSIWFDRPKSKLCQLASGQNHSALH